MTESARGILVYDPNHNNPYGVELARVLAQFAPSVTIWTPVGAEQNSLVLSEVLQETVLAPVGHSTRSMLRRLVMPLRMLFRTLRGSILVAVWVRDPWDGLMILIAAAVRPSKVYFVYHNPAKLRGRRGLAAALERHILRRAHVCVHTDALATAVNGEAKHVHVAPHPSFMLTAANIRREPISNRVGFVGGLREDKGAALVSDVGGYLPAGTQFRTIGQGRLHDDAVAELASAGVEYVSVGGHVPVDQHAFLGELSKLEVVVAPYTQPTESGSTLLCMCLGIPVLALESPTMKRILSDNSVFGSPTELGEAAGRFLANPWSTYRINPAQQDADCLGGWKAALSCKR